MRNAFARSFAAAADNDRRLALVCADISPAGAIDEFRQAHPERFCNVGVAEQSMIGICAGMALRGLRPFAYTIATFALFRPYEFVRNDLCYQNLPVTVVGIGGGVNYSTLGGTHHAMEDVSLACALPNMRVLAPCDPLETMAATQWCAAQDDGPVYLRLGRAGEATLSSDAEPWQFGKLRYLAGGCEPYDRRHVCILSYGPIMIMACKAADELRRRGMYVSLASVHTLKPLDVAGIHRVLTTHEHVVVLEEASWFGGLGMQVKALAHDAGLRCQISAFTLADEFKHVHGSHSELLAAHGLTVPAIVDAVMQGKRIAA